MGMLREMERFICENEIYFGVGDELLVKIEIEGNFYEICVKILFIHKFFNGFEKFKIFYVILS